MYNQKLADAVFDTLIKQALIEVEQEELSSEKLLTTDQISETVSKKNKKIFNRIHKKYVYRNTTHTEAYYIFHKMITAAACFAIIFIAVIMSMPSVRAEAYNSFLKIFDNNISFDFSNSDSQLSLNGKITFGYFPDGYTLSDYVETDIISVYTFSDINDNTIRFKYGPLNSISPSLDSENTAVYEKYLGNTLVYFITDEALHLTCAVWYDDSFAYSIEGNIDPDTIDLIIVNLS